MPVDYKMGILVVDDLQPIRQALGHILRSFGFKNIAYASNGKQAMGVLEEREINLVLLDWNMPAMTGIEFIKNFRATEGYEDVPVIMVTAENEETKVYEAAQSGVTGYLLKPFTPNSVREKISAAIGEKL